MDINRCLCSADGSTHTESNKLYRKVKHRYRPNLSPRQRPTAKARLEQAALAASAEARGATHRARPRSPLNTFHTHTAASMKRDRRKSLYGILFIFSQFYEYSTLEYLHVPILYRVHQAEYVIHILVAASQEYVNVYSTRRMITYSSHPTPQRPPPPPPPPPPLAPPPPPPPPPPAAVRVERKNDNQRE